MPSQPLSVDDMKSPLSPVTPTSVPSPALINNSKQLLPSLLNESRSSLLLTYVVVRNILDIRKYDPNNVE